MRTFGIIVLCIFLFIALYTGGLALGWFGRAVEVTMQEVDPGALLKKYQWFKDASAQLDKKVADIEVYHGRLVAVKEEYKDIPRIKWAREDREQFNLWTSELAGIKASYNSLAAEYNSNMVKINYAFCNIGQLPKGADKPLPREYKPYITE